MTRKSLTAGAVVLVAILALQSAHGCKFADDFKKMMNKAIDLSDVQEGAFTDTEARTPSTMVHNLGVFVNFVNTAGDNDKIEKMTQFAATSEDDLCYWSMQTLPSPQLEDGSFAYNNLTELQQQAEFATTVWQNKVTQGGTVMYGGCTYGSRINRDVVCDILGTCIPGQDNQLADWPTASIILKISGSTQTELENLMLNWRQADDQHGPAITFTFETGWGTGGLVQGKIVKCRDIPEEFHYPAPKECGALNDDGTSSFDSTVREWRKLCNIWEDQTHSPEGSTKCNSCDAIAFTTALILPLMAALKMVNIF